MTKQEAIDQAWSLLELLESLPDGVEIVNAQIENPLRGIVFPLKIHLDSGVEAVAMAFSSPIKTRIPNEFIYSFWNYAVDYMLLSDMPLEEKIYACVPQLVDMWRLKRTKGDVMFQTLECFLDCERSISLTSQLMFLHKNTASYRIKKAQEFLGWDLNNPNIRKYCMISIRILNLYEKLTNADHN